jgi:MFS family permease
MSNVDFLCLWDKDRAKALRAFVSYNLALGAVAPLENTFTLFLRPLSESLGKEIALTNVGFSILILVYATVGPYFSALGQKQGIQSCIAIGLVANLAASIGIVLATSLPQLYLCYFIAGVGNGAVYSPCVVAAMQVMPAGRQALAAGVTCVNYLLLPTLIASPIRYVIAGWGWRQALICQGSLSTLVFAISYMLCPRGDHVRTEEVVGEVQRRHDDATGEARRLQNGLLHDSIVLTPMRSRFFRMIDDISSVQFVLFYIVSCLVSIVYYFVEAEAQVVFEMELPKDSVGVFIGTTTNLIRAPLVG